MTAGSIYLTIQALEEKEKETWKEKIINIVQNKEYENISLEAFGLAIYSKIENEICLSNEVTVYGAGNMAKKYIPRIREQVKIMEIWDAYSKEEDLYGISIKRPKNGIDDFERTIILFIDDPCLRYSISAELRKRGYENLYYFRDYIKIRDELFILQKLSLTKQEIVQLKMVINELLETYDVVNDTYFPVIFSTLHKNLKEKTTPGKILLNKEQGKVIREKLKQVLVIENNKECVFKDEINKFCEMDLSNLYSLARALELLLRNIALNHIKTIERPIKMANDDIYDEFTVFETMKELFLFLFQSNDECLAVIRELKESAKNSIPLLAVYCYFCVSCGEFKEALKTARKGVKLAPNDLLSNETFYKVALECKKNAIYVDEPIPTYDLSEHFCWSGLNFVWCGGFDNQTGNPDFAPCFRPLQCAARPEKGKEFWTGEDWKEFRRSVTDGSFRYCQKNQCPNIVGGWLPKKSNCTERWLKEILEGNLDVIPPIEELHFSYDGHCNLKCPSCRVEIQTNKKEQNEKLDELYKRKLEPFMKNAKHLTLSGCGEAIISPHSKKVLQSFSKEKNKELAVELRTNMTAINEQTWNSLGEGRDVIRHITASIDAAQKESFEKLRYPAKWDTVIKNLSFVQNLRKKGQIDLFEFHVVIQKENVNQLCDIVKMAIDYDADAITFSKLVNWRGMSEKEYQDINPFWIENPLHLELLQEIKKLEKMRNQIEMDEVKYAKGKKKVYINIHFSPDPSSRYDEIRMGRLKIR